MPADPSPPEPTAPGTPFVVSAPSGAGKTSLVADLVAQVPGVIPSVSTTTRAPRPGEEDGVHYHFVSPEAFARDAAAGAFLEEAEVFGNRYATPRAWIEARLAEGLDVVLDIDWQGARSVRAALPGVVSVFILPPGLEELRRRLEGRGQDSPEVVARRMAEARDQARHWNEFDYVVVNGEYADALADLTAVVRSARLARARQGTRHAGLLASLLG